MSSTIIFNSNGVNYSLKTPKYNYITNINLSLIHVRLMPRGWSIWDNGAENDNRSCEAEFLLNATDTETLRTIFSDVNKGRILPFNLNLGSNSGFFPFGPDWGDSGIFQCELIDMVPGPVYEEPWLWFETKLIFKKVTKPSYNLPTQISEGELQIGTITGLRYPPPMPKSNYKHGFTTQQTRDGTVYFIDKTSNADYAETKLSMFCNQSKAAALISHLVNVVRDNNVNIIAPANNYIFGLEASGSGTYVCQFLNEIIKIKHERFDGFSFDLSFYRVSGGD